MRSHRQRNRSRFELEMLEGRVALSHMGAAVEDGPHRNRGGNVAEVHALRHGADDPANHDVNDDRGGAAEAVHHHRGGRVTAVTARHGRGHGADHPAGHK
ncbi:MAG: hypothetical protein JWN86_1584 [Planctomycetota bacterium]|nr:hypothetical protein [Planctomycetota bacterium]